MSIGIYIATNRLVDLPLPAGYHVMVLGSQHAMPRPKEQLRIGEADVLFETDGENIVEKNPFFCELTGLYWLLKNRWKEMEDYVGFCQYRRYFAFHPQRGGRGALPQRISRRSSAWTGWRRGCGRPISMC